MMTSALSAAAVAVIIFRSSPLVAFTAQMEPSTKNSPSFHRKGPHLNVAAKRNLVELSYRRKDEDPRIRRVHSELAVVDAKNHHSDELLRETLLKQKGDAVKAKQAFLDDLEAQRKEIQSKISDLESAARRVDREKLSAIGDLERLQKELSDEEHPPAFSETNSKAGKERELNGWQTMTQKMEASGVMDRNVEFKQSKQEKIGEFIADGRYLLTGTPKRSSSGRSVIWTAHRTSNNGIPTGDVLAAKISSDVEAMEREHRNYVLLGEKGDSLFVDQIDFFPVYGESMQIGGTAVPIHTKTALVMERGKEDLKAYLTRRACGLEGDALRDAGLSALKCLEALHASKIVWTDLKAQNFVVFEEEGSEDITIKGIDLESAMPVKGHPMDYTPEACPPEFARASLLGHASDFVLEFNYDVWSFGMFMYELSAGKGFYDGKPLKYITKMLGGALPGFKPSLENIADPNLTDLIARCLDQDPNRRPSVAEIFRHPYFST